MWRWAGSAQAGIEVWTNVKTFFETVWNGIVFFFTSLWDGLCNTVQTAVMLIGSILQVAFDIITLPFRFLLSE